MEYDSVCRETIVCELNVKRPTNRKDHMETWPRLRVSYDKLDEPGTKLGNAGHKATTSRQLHMKAIVSLEDNQPLVVCIFCAICNINRNPKIKRPDSATRYATNEYLSMVCCYLCQ